ncbi:hypothetical protein WA026_013058 [Henosepilachna vigintioctopunctata]|uniref:DDB1- and CUL4-associated factor 11 n=1 Tax=Henosepilachna vigintioctopunctata TaxID=420089 RepID=A0AAW1UJ64_9CUCU
MGSEMSEGAETAKNRSNVDVLKKSDFYKCTRNAAGLNEPKDRRNDRIESLVYLLRNREVGKSSPYMNMTFGNKCKIANRFLPNRGVEIDYYNGKVFCGIYNKDGSRYLTGSQDRRLRLYKSDDCSYQLLSTFAATDVGWSIIDVAFSPDQKSFAYSTWSSYLHICPVDGDLEKLDALPLVENGRRFCVFSFAFSGDNREVLAAANDGCLYVYDREHSSKVAKVRAHHYDANCVTYADETSNIIYTAGDDGLIKVWDRRTLRENPSVGVGILAGHADGITYLDSRGDGRFLISNSKDQSIKLWDIRQFTKEEDVSEAVCFVSNMNWDYRWQEVPKKLINSHKSKLPGDTSVMTYKGHAVTKTLIRCRFSPMENTGQQFIYTGSGTGHVVVYNALTGKIVQRYKAHRSCVRDIHWHPQRMEYMTASWDCLLKRWTYQHDFEDGEEIFSKTDDNYVITNNGSLQKIRRSLRLANNRNNIGESVM